MFQNKKLKRNATSAIAEVTKVTLCAFNCALPTSGHQQANLFLLFGQLNQKNKNKQPDSRAVTLMTHVSGPTIFQIVF